MRPTGQEMIIRREIDMMANKWIMPLIFIPIMRQMLILH